MNTGMDPAFEAYVVAKAAELIRGGMFAQEAIPVAMRWTLDLYAELADGKTERAKAFHAAAIRRIYLDVRVGALVDEVKRANRT